MNRDTLDKLHDSADMARGVSYELSALARSFDDVGNAAVAKRLGIMADDMAKVSADVFEAAGEAIREACDASEQATKNMMLAVLAVAGERAK